jgi:hypothetical protein
MPNKFTNSEYTKMYFVYGFFSGNCGAAMVEAEFHTEKHLKMYTEL